jgi:hypothetical protein
MKRWLRKKLKREHAVLAYKIQHGDVFGVGNKELENILNSTTIAEKWTLEAKHISDNWNTVKFTERGRENEPDTSVCVAYGGVGSEGAWLALTPEGIAELK